MLLINPLKTEFLKHTNQFKFQINYVEILKKKRFFFLIYKKSLVWLYFIKIWSSESLKIKLSDHARFW